jgi:hypothetical protein
MSSKVQTVAEQGHWLVLELPMERYWSATSSDCRLKRKMLPLSRTALTSPDIQLTAGSSNTTGILTLTDGTPKELGCLAQEGEQGIVPEAITGEKDAERW